jgi:hypothetical protein
MIMVEHLSVFPIFIHRSRVFRRGDGKCSLNEGVIESIFYPASSVNALTMQVLGQGPVDTCYLSSPVMDPSNMSYDSAGPRSYQNPF